MIECDSLSISVITCLVWLTMAIEGVMLSLGWYILFMSVFDFVFAILGMVCRFTSWVGYESEVSSWGINGVFIVLVLHGFDVIKN